MISPRRKRQFTRFVRRLNGGFCLLALATLGTRAACAQIPVGAWEFDQGNGTAAVGVSPGNDAVLRGRAGWADGLTGPHALHLTGQPGTFAEVEKRVVDTTRSYTVSASVKMDRAAGWQTFVSIDGKKVSGFFLQLRGDTGEFAFTTLTRAAIEGDTDTAGSGIDPIEGNWGAKRAELGHPKPYKLRYVEIGNEDWFDTSGSYDDRFAQFYDAIKARYPALQIVATTNVRSRKPDVMDEHYYLPARTFLRDAHHYDNYDRKGPKIFVGEWASQDGDPTATLYSALGDIAFLTGMERNSDIVVMGNVRAAAGQCQSRRVAVGASEPHRLQRPAKLRFAQLLRAGDVCRKQGNGLPADGDHERAAPGVQCHARRKKQKALYQDRQPVREAALCHVQFESGQRGRTDRRGNRSHIVRPGCCQHD